MEACNNTVTLQSETDVFIARWKLADTDFIDKNILKMCSLNGQYTTKLKTFAAAAEAAALIVNQMSTKHTKSERAATLRESLGEGMGCVNRYKL